MILSGGLILAKTTWVEDSHKVLVEYGEGCLDIHQKVNVWMLIFIVYTSNIQYINQLGAAMNLVFCAIFCMSLLLI